MSDRPIRAAPEKPAHYLEGEFLPECGGVELLRPPVDLGVEEPPPVADDRPLEVRALLGQQLALVHHDSFLGGPREGPEEGPALEVSVAEEVDDAAEDDPQD